MSLRTCVYLTSRIQHWSKAQKVRVQCWRRPAHAIDISGQGELPDGVPTMEQLVWSYCSQTGQSYPVVHWPLYQAYSLFRTAAIVQGILLRRDQGNAASPRAASMSVSQVEILARSAAATLEPGTARPTLYSMSPAGEAIR